MILHSKPLRLQRYYKKMTYANLYAIFLQIYHTHASARLRTLSIYTRSINSAGYTLRLRLYTRSKAYTEANANSGQRTSPIGYISPGLSGSSSSSHPSPLPSSLRICPGCLVTGEDDSGVAPVTYTPLTAAIGRDEPELIISDAAVEFIATVGICE